MEYTHKFSSGPLLMDDIIENYFSLRKARGKCLRCSKYNQFWSCPEFGFDEKLLLEQFQYLYVIGREYAVPKEHKQTITGVMRTKNYIEEVQARMNTESWRDLLEVEKDYPNAMTLRPGNCNICEAAGIKCAKQNHERCRHSELMRFSMESLGLDADSIAKFEVGMLLSWPSDNHLPEKIACLMGVMTNEKIPMQQLKRYFPDAKKSYLKVGQTILGGEDAPRAKRLDSWLDHQARELLAKEAEQEDHGSWLGFKDESLSSGDFVKSRPWAEGDAEFPGPPPEYAADAPPEGDRGAPSPQPAEEKAEAPDENGEPQYKWLGFKRPVEEAEALMRERPIPKFNVAEEAAVPEEPAPRPAETVAPSGDSQASRRDNIQFDRLAMIRQELERTIRKAMPEASDAQVMQLLAETLQGAVTKRQHQEHVAPGSEGATVLSDPPGSHPAPPEPPMPVQAPPQPAPEPAVQPPEPASQLEEKAAPERQDRGKVRRAAKPKPARKKARPKPKASQDVLGAALAIAQAVVSETEAPAAEDYGPTAYESDEAEVYETAREAVCEDALTPSEAAPSAEAETSASEAPPASAEPAPEEPADPNDLKGDDDTRYKWLGFKAELSDGDQYEKGAWRKKKNY
jgi:predicted metal-binding protein